MKLRRHSAAALRCGIMLDAGKCCVAESSVGAGAAAAELTRERCYSAHIVPRNGGTSVSGATGAYEASETLGSSFTLRHRAWMQANAVSQRAVWGADVAVVNLQLEQCLSMGGRRKNGGASVSGANRVHEASETLCSSFALRHHAWMLANAVSFSRPTDPAPTPPMPAPLCTDHSSTNSVVSMAPQARGCHVRTQPRAQVPRPCEVH